MGWGSASGIFETVADALIESKATPEAITNTCVKLICDLSSEDWDTQQEALETYVHMIPSVWVNAVIQAFVQTGHGPRYCHEITYSVGHLGRTVRLTCSDLANHKGKHTTSEGEW